MGNPDKQPSDAAQSPAHPLMENSVADHPLLQMEGVRKECMALRTQFATENARLEAVASSALAEVAQLREEVAQQHDEIASLKASSCCEACGGQGLTGSLSSATSSFLEEALRNQEATRIELQEERQQTARLALEKDAIEEMHCRDIEKIERMLQDVTAENAHLKSIAEKKLPAISEKESTEDIVKNFETASSDEALRSTQTLDEPEMEPRRESLDPQDRLLSTLNNFSYNFMRDVEKSFAEIA